MKYYNEEEEVNNTNEQKDFLEPMGCKFCWDDKKNKEKEPLMFFDPANNLRMSIYCPWCGRKYGG
jgi:hypothetical protein